MRSPIALTLFLGTLATGCADVDRAPDADSAAAPTEGDRPAPQEMEQIQAIDAYLAGVDSVFAPLPLMRPGDEEALRRFGNGAQLEVARRIGIPRDATAAEIEELRSEGELVPLEDSRYWVLRDLDYSSALATPRLYETLEAIGRGFQARLEEIGAPPFRFEISSVLRSAEDQERLREVNPNAALGESTHQYATTVDIPYNAFAVPLSPGPDIEVSPVADAYRRVAHERIGARRALEIKAILAETLQDLQDQGRIMVTLERLQPVFHLTARD